MASATTITQLAKWIREFDYDGVPDRVLDLAKFSLLDCLGGAFAAPKYSEAVGECLETLDHLEDAGGSTVIGRKRKASLLNAVFANGFLIRALDFNDHLPADPNDGSPVGSHPSDNMAVGLSVGEKEDSSGRDVLTAMVMGYEINGRFQKLIEDDAVWDHTTATGLVAPAIAGRLMHLDEDKLASALGFGMARGSTPGSVRRGHISAGKFLADPLVAHSSMMGTLLAAHGVTGPVAAFEGSKGLGLGLFGGADLSSLHAPLARHYMFEGVCLKAYPCFANSQASVSAALDARRAFNGNPSDIARIVMTMNDIPGVTQQLADKTRRYPSNQETADHSYHFLVAVALVDGEVTFRQFENERWNDPQIVDLMNKIEITPTKDWDKKDHCGSPASLKIVNKSGREYSSEVCYPKGNIKNAFDAADVSHKFKGCVDGLVEPKRADAICEMVLGLEKQKSVKPLMGLLAG
jgi:2-methylcitrate dehydratase